MSKPTPSLAAPEIEESDLKAVRRFLTSYRDEQRRERAIHPPGGPNGPATLRHGIVRARLRSSAKTGA